MASGGTMMNEKVVLYMTLRGKGLNAGYQIECESAEGKVPVIRLF